MKSNDYGNHENYNRTLEKKHLKKGERQKSGKLKALEKNKKKNKIKKDGDEKKIDIEIQNKREIKKINIKIKRLKDSELLAIHKKIIEYKKYNGTIYPLTGKMLRANEYIKLYTDILLSIINRPDEVLCADLEIRTEADAELHRIMKKSKIIEYNK